MNKYVKPFVVGGAIVAYLYALRYVVPSRDP